MTRPAHITHILTGLNRVLDYEQLLQSDRTSIRLAIAELATVYPALPIPRSDIPNAPRATDERSEA